MAIKTLLTAVGRFERRSNGCGRSCPVIVLNGKDYMVDMQEMVIWTSLNWRIVKREEIETLYAKSVKDSGYSADRSWNSCVERLLVRGLIISGSGETEYDALYDLISAMYIIPASGSFFLRALSFLKLTLLNHVSISKTRKLFQRDLRTPDEKRVMKLARQALLSTAEIIKCVEKDISRLPDDQSILDGLYDDEDTTSDNISYLVKASAYSKPVVLAVANLYLRQQIIFERI